MKKTMFGAIASVLLFLVSPGVWSWRALAQGEVLGIHILSPGEVNQAQQLLGTERGSFHYVTVPFGFSDIGKTQEWQQFFDQMKQHNLIPILRLTTKFSDGRWAIPKRQDIMEYSQFLSSLDWYTDNLTVVLFNEPNHANEWNGSIDPTGYASIASFAADWFHTEPKHYTILPAGLDLAAPTGSSTMEAFQFWKFAFNGSGELAEKFDGWTSHSYPNPAFASSPTKKDKSSLHGYVHELEFLKQFTPKEFSVYITETGWDQSQVAPRLLSAYYQNAYTSIWKNDPRIKAVTPFLLQGAPGAFASFSFLDASGKPTRSYEAYRRILSLTN